MYIQSKKQFESEDLLIYPIVLTGYLSDSSGNNLILKIEFDNVNRYFLSQLNGLTIPSLIFIVIIVLILIWVFRAFYLQKNLIINTNEFINNLTHELKTPVFSMGVATKILEEKFKKDGADIIKMLRVQVERMNHQIDKVLELAIIEGKKDILDRKRMDLMPVLQRTSENFGALIQLDGGQFKSDFEGEAYWINGDEYHLENVFNSLLENAKKYSRADVDIEFLAKIKGRNVQVEVQDKGIGMSDESQKKIFDKFFRVSNGDRHDVKGYGLGLHYVKRIVTLHKGKIEVKSSVEKGSTFRVILTLI
jgi:two-component system phosphate regulon sensor histidine kinase PhoR